MTQPLELYFARTLTCNAEELEVIQIYVYQGVTMAKKKCKECSKSKKDKMPCNKPMKSDRPGKKRMVKACANGKEKLIHFGATGYKSNYSAAARKNFRARHNCDQATNKLTAKYWACKNLWSPSSTKYMKGKSR